MRLLLSALIVIAASAPALSGERRGSFDSGREYEDPYIWDGWRSDGGYRGKAYYAKASPYLARRNWPFSAYYEHRWKVADDIESLSGVRYHRIIEAPR